MTATSRNSRKTPVTLLSGAILLALHALPALAQETPPADPASTLDTVNVTGVRETQRDSAAVKRDASVIVDAVVNDEIGALPDNSVAETLERVAGVTADRFKGSASEISVRGLGPYLGFSTVNGREVSSGGGDRAVSFQQFPSELTNGVLVYKSQQADFIEGGVSGVIELRTARPLDFKKRRVQLEGRAHYMPAAERAGDGLGSRLSGSYVDQFDTSVGRVGVALGVATTDSTAPEDFYTASSSFRPCNSINPNPRLLTGSAAGNCSYAANRSTPVYFVPNQVNFRQLRTDDTRRAVVGDVQWQPNDRWDVNLDVQLSKRESFEDRHDLVIAEGRRGIAPLEQSANGALLRYAGNSYLESQSLRRNRNETYAGGGLSAAFKASDAITVKGDLSYSRTHREQDDMAARLRSNTRFGPSGRVAYVLDQTSDIPRVDFANPINLDDHAAFTGNAYARRAFEDRVDEIKAARLDLDYDRYGTWHQFRFGVRASEHGRTTDVENNNDIESISTAAMLAGNANCRIGNIVDDWGKGSGTNIHSWAQFDTRCLYRSFTGSDDLGPAADPRSAGDLDITERIYAAYAMGSFSGSWGDVPVTGNLGVRLVDTHIDSAGYRGGYRLVTTTDPVTGTSSYRLDPVAGSFDRVRMKHRHRNVLPSFNISAELQPGLYLKGALYKALARSNIEDMGSGRSLITDGAAATPEDALAGATGGNPRLEPMEAWNADLSFEYYQNDFTSYSLALYYKILEAGVVAAADNRVQEQFVVDGRTYTVPVAQQGNSSGTSNLRGVEVGVNHAFTYLPGAWSGLGVQLNYNFAQSNFSYPDPSAVEPAWPLAQFTDPAGLSGFSRHSGSATLYYEYAGLSLRAAYKYRSGYFKPSSLTANRYVDDVGFLDLSASYNINRHWQIKAQALNVTNQHQLMFRPVEGSIAESSFFGRSYFVGVRFRY